MEILEILAAVFISLGILLFVAEVVGLQKFPDFYTRMHAAGKGDTLSTILMVGGFILHSIHEGGEAGNWNVLVKLGLIAAFILLTSPTSTHALMKAGYDSGLKPFEMPRRKSEAKDDAEPKEEDAQ
jgi:multicomponent Na+:H+ antiporter subunit G